MATNYKVLGQLVPSAPNTYEDVYTVPANTQSVISTIVIANLQTVAGVFRIAIRPAGATLENKHHIAYDIPLAANDSTTLTLGITLNDSDVVTVMADLDTVAFSFFGSEIS